MNLPFLTSTTTRNPPPSTTLDDPTRPSPSRPAKDAISLDTRSPTPHDWALRPPSPPTPPSTPIEPPSPTAPTAEPVSPSQMFALTQAKLNRVVTQEQLTGRETSLRQIVLLSNIFGTPAWYQAAQEEMRSAEIDRRRKEDEERWLDETLSTLLVEGEADGEGEDYIDIEPYVEVSIRTVSDSGFLEGGAESYVVSGSSLSPIVETPAPKIDEEGDPIEAVRHFMEPLSDYPYPPPSPPLPPRSPPIPIPSLPSRATFSLLDTSSPPSPPLYPPALSPDCSPGPSDELMGASLDSIESEAALHQREHWSNLVAPSSDYSKRPSPYLSSDWITDEASTLDIPMEDPSDAFISIPPFPRSPTTSPPRSPSSLTVALIRHSPTRLPLSHPQPLSPTWTPPSPRSLSLFQSPSAETSIRKPNLGPLHHGLAKSAVDAVDFGYQFMTGSGNGAAQTLASGNSIFVDTPSPDADEEETNDGEEEERLGRRGSTTLAVVLSRPLSWTRHATSSRSRSPPPRAIVDLREWSRFTQIYDGDDEVDR